MPQSLPFSLRALWFTMALTLPAAAAPVAVSDHFYGVEDTPLPVPFPGVLLNDLANGITGPLSAVKTADPAHGTVVMQSDGSFTYNPEANFSGVDSFQYKVVQAQGPVTFTVDQPNSVMTINVQSFVAATGVSDNKTTTAKAKGTMTALITPVQAPFASAQIRSMDIALADRVSLTLCVAKLFGACVGTLGAVIEPNGLTITMNEIQAGPAVAVNAGLFTQTGNFLNTQGTVFFSTGGVASGITVPESAPLNAPNTPYDFTNAGITQTGNMLTLSVPIDLTQTLTETDYSATVRVTGTLKATAPVPAGLIESAPAAVTLEVTGVDDPPVAAADRYYTRQNHAISIPATGSRMSGETLIGTGSVWKYATGASQGTAWRNPDFVDTSWAAATGILGYGDPDILPSGTIPARANMAIAASASNPNYPTAYFRKEFTLDSAAAGVDARLEFQRDDACIIYLNGTEIHRDSAPYTAGGTAPLAATGEIAYATYAAAAITPDSDGAVYKSIPLNPALMRDGKNVIAVEVHQQGNTSSDLRFDLRCLRTTRPTEVLSGAGSLWKYATGSDAGTAWRVPEFNDSAWPAAAGPLGYDTDIPASSTIPARGNPAAAASASNPNYPTAYFRKEFTLTNPYDTLEPRVEFQRDDACIIYVNGVEIYRDSAAYTSGGPAPLPASGDVPYSQYASSSIAEADSTTGKTVTFSPALLREGRNVIAAEVHQQSSTSSDLRFDLKCFRTTGAGGLADNDTDIDGPEFELALLQPPAHGVVTIQPDGSFTYLPAPGFPGAVASASDSFVYRHTYRGAPYLTHTVVSPMQSEWRYLATGAAAPQNAGITTADWRHAGFDDSAWVTGTAEFGYGDGDEATVVEDDATPGSPTAGSASRFITTYFRRKFEYSGSTSLLTRLKVRVIRDDGVAIFLNGTRIVRDNLPEGWNHLTRAPSSIGGADETTPAVIYDIPASALKNGLNILAAEIHQSAPDSSDCSFDMELTAESAAGATVEVVVLSDDLDNDRISDTWERLHGLNGTVNDGMEDPDRDGLSNRAEFLAGTDPFKFSSRLLTTGLVPAAAGRLQLSFASVPGILYQLQESTGLSGWKDTGLPFPGSTTLPETSLLLDMPVSPNRFYRVKVVNDWQ